MSPLSAHRPIVAVGFGAALLQTLSVAVLACLVACDDHPSPERMAAPSPIEPLHPSIPSSSPPRAAPLVMGCDGSPLPTCSAGLTGPSCTVPCPATESAASCGFELYCHGDGSVYGLATRGTVLYPAASSSGSDPSPDEAHAALVDWITTHEADLGLAPGLDDVHLGLSPAPGFVQPMGALSIHRFAQTYRSWPVLPPDDLVQVVHTRSGAIQLTGRIVDARIDYEHHDAQAPAQLAAESIRYHAYQRLGMPRQEVVVDGPTLVAMPETQQIAWLGHARHPNGAVLARVIVEADPTWTGRVLPLVSWRPVEVDDLATTAPVEVRTVSPASDPAAPDSSIETTLVHGEPLIGSIHDATGEVQLATDQVVVLDLNGASYRDLVLSASRILDPSGEFLEPGGDGFQGQMTHHLLHSWYARIDGYATDPETGTTRWDSALPAYLPAQSSTAPAGTFRPRVLAFVDSSTADCSPTAVACAAAGDYDSQSGDGLVFPELAHEPGGPELLPEVTGRLSLPLPRATADGITTLAHEFGHMVDLFTGPGFTGSIAPDCGGACVQECIEDTSDEAPPLGETVAQLMGMVVLHDAFEPVGFEYCELVAMLSRSNIKAFDPGPCIPEGEEVSVLERPGDCSKTEPYCDKPERAGFRLECCDPAHHADCVVEAPTDCPTTGLQRQVPTGLCHPSAGYDTHSVMQAFWQLLNGQRCEPSPPFSCDVVEWPGGIPPEDVAVPALLYSLRLDPLSYEQLFDGMATYIACTHGPAAYLEYNAVVCAHGIRACDEPMPVECEACGNGVREGSETCDGSDWEHDSCTDFEGFDGGELKCNQLTCELDLGFCLSHDDGGLDTTAGPRAPDPDPQVATEPTSTGEPGADDLVDRGCACRTSRGTGASLPLLAVLACLLHRHRHRHRRRRSP